MKKVIGLVVFVTAGLLAFTRDVPAAQVAPAPEAVSSQMSGDELAIQAPELLGCPSSAPICCEPNGTGGCLLCIPRGAQCP